MPRSSEGIAVARPSSSSWSRALRASGRLRVRRATASAGSSSRSLPPAKDIMRGPLGFACGASAVSYGLFEHDEDVALGDGLTLLTLDLGDLAVVLGLDRHLHLHRLEDDHGVSVGDLVSDLDLDLPDRAGDVRLDIRHGGAQYPALSRERDSRPLRAAVIAARNEADRIGATLDALREAMPAAELIVGDDASDDGTGEEAMRHGATLVGRNASH